MNLVVATIPDNPGDLVRWLEHRLAGLDLDALVAELTALHRPGPAHGITLEQVLGPHLDEIYQSGLSSLSPEILSRLLTRPALLLQLQERVLLHGGPYWDEVARSMPALQLLVEQGRKSLPESVSEMTHGTRGAEATRRAAAMLPWYRQAWVVSLATAAVVLLAVGLGLWVWLPSQQGAIVAWGWERPGALREDVPPGQYLENLASAAQEWFRQRPDTPEALARRINQTRQGCSTLILARHRPLAEKDRKWLVERCQAWAKKFDRFLVELEAGKDVLVVRREMDETVETLTKALRQRARLQVRARWWYAIFCHTEASEKKGSFTVRLV